MNVIKDQSLFERSREFFKSATTRSGVKFRCKVFQVNQNGDPSSVKGEIYLRDEKTQEEIPVEMIWSLEGQALLIGPAYDLVKEVPFE